VTMIRRNHAQLLSRARAALETPGDLDADALLYLIKDLTSAEDAVKSHIVPWPVDIHVAEIDHCHGTNVYAALTREALMAQVAAFCKEWWSSLNDTRDPNQLTDEEAVSVYFDNQLDEYLSTDRIPCEPSRVLTADAT
jgi:hypothetical protein